MIWRFLVVATLVACTVIVTLVLRDAYLGIPIQNPASTLIIPAATGVGAFCRLMAWLDKPDDE